MVTLLPIEIVITATTEEGGLFTSSQGVKEAAMGGGESDLRFPFPKEIVSPFTKLVLEIKASSFGAL